ncbi:MAG: ABC transporter permease [Opitutaceae bacterium]|jgi:lipopolysaccharide transport system permease protein|nr:ABC transporter permease [Opitutaceae bacterium]
MEPNSPPEIILEAGRANRNYWHDLWRFRELLGFLAWRDIKVRYKQTTLGVLWALIQPAVTLAVFTFIFGKLAGMPSGNAPYPLLVLCGLLPWQLFSAAFSNASGSLVANTHLISKVYFPRLIVPLSSVAVALIDFAVVLVLLAVMCLWWQFTPDWRIIVLPLFIVLTLLTAIGTGLWLTALTVKYRDFRFVVPFLLQVGLFLSPVGFSSTNLPNWRFIYSLNPMVGAIDGFRWCLLRGEPALDPLNLAISIGMAALLLASGIWYFRRTERTFADLI